MSYTVVIERDGVYVNADKDYKVFFLHGEFRIVREHYNDNGDTVLTEVVASTESNDEALLVQKALRNLHAQDIERGER